MASIDIRSRTPIYEQLTDRISKLIISGCVREHDRLPDVMTLSRELGINPNTVSRAYSELEKKKIIYTSSDPEKEYFIAPISDSELDKLVLEDFDTTVAEAVYIGISTGKLKNRIDEVTAK